DPTLANSKLTDRQTGQVVHAEDRFDFKALHHSVIDHLAPAAATFLRRLKDHRDRTLKIARLGQVFCRTKKHGSMAIVTAGVHPPRYGGAVRKVRLLLHRQGIHISSQADDRASAPRSPDQAHNACSAEACHHLVAAKFPQAVSDEGCRLIHVEEQLRVLVQRASPTDDFVLKVSDPTDDWHCTFLFRGKTKLTGD